MVTLKDLEDVVNGVQTCAKRLNVNLSIMVIKSWGPKIKVIKSLHKNLSDLMKVKDRVDSKDLHKRRVILSKQRTKVLNSILKSRYHALKGRPFFL